MNYVYVPYADKEMDNFAFSLVNEKNKVNKFFGRHKLINRDNFGTPLSVVGWNDRLYTMAHGSGTHCGVCVNTNPRKDENKYVTGEDFAKLLVKLGLKNTGLDVRLWTCWGGKSGNDAWQGPIGNLEHSLSSFTLRVACGFKELGYKKITVVGYRKLVNISGLNLQNHQGHKVLQDEEDNFSLVTDEDKVRYQVSAM